MDTNRAIQLSAGTGEPLDIYKLVTIPKPKASEKQVVVKVLLRPVNPTDMLVLRWGTWANILGQAVVGSEGYGVVEEVGQGVTKFKKGDRVVPLIWTRYYSEGYGLWRDYVEIPEVDLVAVPDNISDVLAAQFLINPWTVYGLLETLNVPKGEYLLQTAANSVLGRMMIALAKHYGIKTINIVRRDSGIELLKALGADYVINSNSEDVKAKVMEITGGKGAYAACDAVAGASPRLIASCLAPNSKLLLYGALSANHAEIELADLMKNVQISFWLINDYASDLARREKTSKAVMELLSKKIFDPDLGNVYKLEEFKKAIEESEKDARGGKVFLSSS